VILNVVHHRQNTLASMLDSVALKELAADPNFTALIQMPVDALNI
jgi:hypothetical protein